MKIKDGFVLREVGSNYLVIAVGKNAKDFNAMITLNEVGAFLFNKLTNEITFEGLVDALLGEYEVDRATAEKDVKAFIEKLQKGNLFD